MRALLQRVSKANVSVNNEIISAINQGLVVFVGVEENDGLEDINWVVHKLTQMRIFGDETGKMNKNVLQCEGELLIVSQFTLHASTKKGNRPSFIRAARPDIAIPLHEKFIEACTQLAPTQSGKFGADMQVALTNDGPVTIWLDSKNKT